MITACPRKTSVKVCVETSQAGVFLGHLVQCQHPWWLRILKMLKESVRPKWHEQKNTALVDPIFYIASSNSISPICSCSSVRTISFVKLKIKVDMLYVCSKKSCHHVKLIFNISKIINIHIHKRIFRNQNLNSKVFVLLKFFLKNSDI